MSDDRVAINPDYLWTLKWWAFGGRFPLIPQFKIKPANKFNTSGFHFQWLGFRVWSMDSVDTGVEFIINDDSLMLRLRLPYLIAGFWLPIFPASFSQKLWRKPTYKD